MFLGGSASLNIMASAVLLERHPLERTFGGATSQKALSMTLGSACGDALFRVRIAQTRPHIVA
jgi:hypothetical protein